MTILTILLYSFWHYILKTNAEFTTISSKIWFQSIFGLLTKIKCNILLLICIKTNCKNKKQILENEHHCKKFEGTSQSWNWPLPYKHSWQHLSCCLCWVGNFYISSCPGPITWLHFHYVHYMEKNKNKLHCLYQC